MGDQAKPTPPIAGKEVRGVKFPGVPVLSVHRNTLEKRRVRETSKDLRKHAERLIRECDIRAYALVGIDAKGDSYAVIDTGGIMPMVAFPAAVQAIMAHEIGSWDVKDDWQPNLNPKRVDD